MMCMKAPEKRALLYLGTYAGKDKTMENTFIFNVKTSEKGFFDLFDLFSGLAGTFSIANTRLSYKDVNFIVIGVDSMNNEFTVRVCFQGEPNVKFLTEFLKENDDRYEVTYKHVLPKGDLIFTPDALKAGDYFVHVPKNVGFVPPILKDLDGREVSRKQLKDALELLYMRKDRLTNLISNANKQYGVSFQEYAFKALSSAV